MSKDRKTIKEKKKEPSVNVNKKQSSYQNDKGLKSESTVGKK